MNENKTEVKGFFLYFDQWNLISRLPDDQVKGVITACCDYMQGNDPDLTNPTVFCVFGLVRPTLEKSKARAIAGKKGGEASGRQAESKNEANDKQTTSKQEANGKQTEANDKQTGSKNAKMTENPVSKPEANVKQTVSKPEANGSYLKSKIQDNIYNTPPTPPQGEAVVVSSECEPVSSGESTSTPTGKRRRKREADAPSEYSPLFEEFWEAYPRRRRVNKFAAWKKFWAAQQAGILPDDIVQRVRNRQCEEDWAKEDGQYVPAPEVWLNKRGWEDDGCVWDPMGYKKLPQEIQDLMEEHYQWSLKLKHGMWQPGESQEEFDERYEKWQRINLEYTERIQAMGVSSYEPLP